MASDFGVAGTQVTGIFFFPLGIRVHAQERRKAHEIWAQELLEKIDESERFDSGLIR